MEAARALHAALAEYANPGGDTVALLVRAAVGDGAPGVFYVMFATDEEAREFARNVSFTNVAYHDRVRARALQLLDDAGDAVPVAPHDICVVVDVVDGDASCARTVVCGGGDGGATSPLREHTTHVASCVAADVSCAGVVSQRLPNDVVYACAAHAAARGGGGGGGGVLYYDADDDTAEPEHIAREELAAAVETHASSTNMQRLLEMVDAHDEETERVLWVHSARRGASELLTISLTGGAAAAV